MKIDPVAKYKVKSMSSLEKKKENKVIVEVLKTCLDPELGIDVWSLGLIYDILHRDGVHIVMTFTTPLCPYGPQIVDQIKTGLKMKKIEVEVHLTFNPLWKPSDEVKEMLGLAH